MLSSAAAILAESESELVEGVPSVERGAEMDWATLASGEGDDGSSFRYERRAEDNDSGCMGESFDVLVGDESRRPAPHPLADAPD